MKITSVAGASLQSAVGSGNIRQPQPESTGTPAYEIELSGTQKATQEKIAPALKDRRGSLLGYDLDREATRAMKASSQTQTPLWEITATEMSMDVLSSRNGDVSAGISMGILPSIYAQTKNFDTEVTARQAKFLQAEQNIQAEGAQGFLRYNRMYAGMAKEASESINAGTIEQWKKAGQWSAQLDSFYQTAKDYADKLQAKSGVLIGVDLPYKSTEHLAGANRINAAYLGSYAQVGVNLLNFMAGHQEAEDIWVKAVQGSYQDAEALYGALEEQGHADIAAALQENTQTARTKFGSGTMKLDKSVAQFSYHNDMGEVWRQSVGEDAYNRFAAKFGLQDAKITYSGKELASIAKEAPGNLADLKANPQKRDVSGHIEDNKEKAAAPKQADNTEEQIAALQDKIKRIQQQISALKKNPSLSQEELTRQTQNYQKQIETYKRQIMDIKIQQMERQKYN